MKLPVFVATGCVVALPCRLLAQGVTVPKTNPIPVYVQIMPWFQTPETLGGTNWGWHWTMNNCNPNTILPNGQRQIASYYYPLIGTYDSSDPYVIEYQMLLMKLSGISGTTVDWYGQQGSNGDEASLLSASNKIVSATQTYGLRSRRLPRRSVCDFDQRSNQQYQLHGAELLRPSPTTSGWDRITIR